MPQVHPRRFTHVLPRALWTLGLAIAAHTATAAVDEPAPKHPWLSAPIRLHEPHTYFSNLADGARIQTPYLLKFGLARYGLAPIVKPVAGAGHHHLLVNRDLPLDFKQPLPFNDQYIHFGKGQMETVLTLAPGSYTLRLLLADDKHIPHFIYSKPMRVEVTAKDPKVDPKSLINPGVAIMQPANGESVKGPFRVGFHASGLNVGHKAITEPGVGHFRLVAERAGAATERIAFTQGTTEVWLSPPAGNYKMSVELVRNGEPGDVMATSAPVTFQVR